MIATPGPGPKVAPKHGYRADIDGLRAVAVLPIVLFHAGVEALAGGFIGVDIFFIISGFLITRIIVEELGNSTFSLAGFYRRRIVRIFPALFAMLGISLLAGVLLVFPAELRSLAHSTAAAATSVSNFLFWQEAGYFAPDAQANPLLHTWSLAVEEQFYIFYPLFLLLLRRQHVLTLRTALWLVIAASLAAGAWLVVNSESAAFYLLPGRAWELALGGLVAAGGFPKIASSALRQLVSLAGAAMILLSLVFVREDLLFPVPSAIPVCLGTALLIAYGEAGAIGTVLSHGILRFIGRISYSVYLWHWPIVTFYRIETGFALDWQETIWLVAASLAAGWLSFALFEQPFLRRFRSAAPRPVIAAGLGAIAVALLSSAGLAKGARSVTPFGERALEIADAGNYRVSADFARQYGPPDCFVRSSNRSLPEVRRREACENFSATRPNALLMGDSFAAQYATALPERFSGMAWSFALSSGCRPTLTGGGSRRCREIKDRAYDELLSEQPVDIVILGGRWQEDDLPLLASSIARIRASGAQAVVLGPAVEYDSGFPSIYARAVERGNLDLVGQRRMEHPQRFEPEMRQIAQDEGAIYVSLLDRLCPAGNCVLEDGEGQPLQWDYGHLTLTGIRALVATMPDLAALAASDDAAHETRRPADEI